MLLGTTLQMFAQNQNMHWSRYGTVYYVKPEHLIIQHFVEEKYSKFCFKYNNFLVIYFIFNFLIYIYIFIS